MRITGKERDGQTGLDYFGARYYSEAQERFTSPDEPFADQDESRPQSWNLYAYGRDNPLRFTDPTGRCSEASGGYTHEGHGLFPGPCSGATIGDSNNNKNSTTVGVGRDEANLIMLSMIGNALSNPRTYVQLASDAGRSAASFAAPGPSAVAECITPGGNCNKTNLALAAVPFGPGRLARILRRHSAASVVKNISRFAPGLDDAAHVESMIESAFASPNRAAGYADGVAYIDANLGVVIGATLQEKLQPQSEWFLTRQGMCTAHFLFPRFIRRIHAYA